MSEIKTLPPQAFDGQTFIDAYRVEWKFDGSAQCWRRIGQRTDIPVASELQTGLLSAQLKQLIDGIPAGGGHFGIIAQPLLSLVPQNPDIILKDEVRKTTLTKSGTSITGKSVENRAFNPEQFVGKLLIFRSGILTKKAFLVFTNDQESIFIEGDATEAAVGDKFEILDSAEFNPSGVLLGDILLVSDTIDITCVDGEGLPLAGGAACNVDIIQCDSAKNPPGLNFQLNKDFLDSLCVIIPGCKGSTGDRGDRGVPGLDGTGDGPQGDPGDSGDNAPTSGNTFTGIRIIDVDDIYDTAVVSMELDAENGKLNIIRAKVRTPETDMPATQLLSTPINRTISFKSDQSFEYTLMKPSVDPIEIVDVDVLKYPQQFVKPNGQTPEFTTTVNKVKLSTIVDAVLKHYEQRLDEINDEYNQRLREYVEGKDVEARTILANLAQSVAECEFQLPIDFCLGVTPADCGQKREVQSIPFDDPLSSLILSFPNPTEGDGGVTSTDLGFYSVVGTSFTGGGGGMSDPPPVGMPDPPPMIPYLTDLDRIAMQDSMTMFLFPNNSTSTAVETLPSATGASTLYTAQYIEGTLCKSGVDSTGSPTTGFLAGTGTLGEGVQIIMEGTDTNGDPVVVQKPLPAPNFITTGIAQEEFALLEAYTRADLLNKTVTMDATGLDNVRIMAVALVDSSRVDGNIMLNVKRTCAPLGTIPLL